MMMKAEIAREMMRSRSQTPNPEPTRSGDDVGGTTTAPPGEVGLPASPLEPGAIGFPSMPALLYTEPAIFRESHRRHIRETSSRFRYFRCSNAGPFSQTPGYNMANIRGNLMMPGFLRSKIVYRSLRVVFLLLVTLSLSAQWMSPQEEGGVPAYNAAAPP